MRVTVVGGGSWGTAFSVLLRDHGHEVTLACRDAEQAAAIEATGRNPRYLSHVDLHGIAATTIAAGSGRRGRPRRRRRPERRVRRDASPALPGPARCSA